MLHLSASITAFDMEQMWKSDNKFNPRIKYELLKPTDAGALLNCV